MPRNIIRFSSPNLHTVALFPKKFSLIALLDLFPTPFFDLDVL